MEFNFPKLPHIIHQKGAADGVPEVEQQAGGFSIPSGAGDARVLEESPLTGAVVLNEPMGSPIHREEILGSGRLLLPIPEKHKPDGDFLPKGSVSDKEPTKEANNPADVDSTQTEEIDPFEKTDEFPIEAEDAAGIGIIEEMEIAEDPSLAFVVPEEEKEVEAADKKIAAASFDEPPNVSGAQREMPAEPVNIADVIASTTSKIFTIGVGQSLEQAAEELGIDVFDLLRANPHLLKDPLIFAGQRVKAPPQTAVAEAARKTAETASFSDESAAKSPLQSAGFTKASFTAPPEGAGFELLKAEATLARNDRSVESVRVEIASSANAETHVAEPKRNDLERPTMRSEKDRAEEKKEPIKQNEKPMPTFGLHGDRKIESEPIFEDPKPKSDLKTPEPFDEWAAYIYKAASKYNLEASLIASVIWLESGGKNIVGKDGHGYGLMQIDDRRYKEWLDAHDGGLDPENNIDFGSSLIREYIDYFRGKVAEGLAAFDCGIDAVEEALVLGKSPDRFTRGGNYSITALTQQEYFRKFF